MTTINLQVGASTDDCHRELGSDAFSLTGTGLFAGDYSSSFYDYSTGTRFLNVTIGQGDTIDAASMQFRAKTLFGALPTTYIGGEDIDNAATFSTVADYDGRARTAASVSWIPPAWVDATWYTSSELKTVIQEIVDRGGWASGNDLVTFWRDTVGWGGTERAVRAYSYNAGASFAPKLDIDYTAGAAGVTVVAALATATALTYSATITTGLVVAAALATATALALAAKHVNTIPAAVATATAKSYDATVTGAALIAAALATATAKSYAAIIATTGAVTISAAVATASALAYAAKHINTIPAAVSIATAKSLAGTVTGGLTVVGAIATAAAKSYEVAVTGTARVIAALATATAQSSAATITTTSVVTILAALASATARSYAVTTTGTAVISAAVSTATARSWAATIFTGLRLVNAAVATATALAKPLTLTGDIISAARRLAYYPVSLVSTRFRRRGRR